MTVLKALNLPQLVGFMPHCSFMDFFLHSTTDLCGSFQTIAKATLCWCNDIGKVKTVRISLQPLYLVLNSTNNIHAKDKNTLF